MAEQEVAKHTKKVYKVWASKEHSWQHKLQEFLIEILIIVFAVSLSIWFHSLSEKSHDRHEAKQYLEGLKKDLVLDIKEMRLDISFLTKQIDFFKYLVNNRTQNINLDSIGNNFLSLGDTQYNNNITKTTRIFTTEIYLRPNISRFDALKYSGKMNIIENKELLDEIINLYEEKIPILVNSGQSLSDYRHATLYAYLESNRYLSDSNNAAFMQALKTDENLKYIFQRIIDRTPYLINLYNDVIQHNEKLVAMIEKEVK
jgi:hypothetical protein